MESEFFDIHCSKLKPDPFAYLGEDSDECVTHTIGYAAWCSIEKLHPEVTVWETITPYFETRNIHFYVNRCGFYIVEYLNKHHPGDMPLEEFECDDPQFPAGMFRFVKQMK